MERIAVDTTFLIDLQNERRGRGGEQGARAFLQAYANCEFFLPVVARGEFLEGFENPESSEAREWVDALKTLDLGADVATEYARVARQLRLAGQLIGSNDLWIGCAARVAQLPLATRNPEHFRKIPGLTVVDYRVGTPKGTAPPHGS